MIGPMYLRRGLSAMARAWRANTMAGHPGAALVAGCCFADVHRDLDARVHSGIESELDRIIAGEESWFDPDAVGMTIAELFEPFPDAPSHPEPTHAIAEALSGNIDALRQSGHNVIFAALAIKALREHPQHATSEDVSLPTLADVGGRRQTGDVMHRARSREVAGSEPERDRVSGCDRLPRAVPRSDSSVRGHGSISRS